MRIAFSIREGVDRESWLVLSMSFPFARRLVGCIERHSVELDSYTGGVDIGSDIPDQAVPPAVPCNEERTEANGVTVRAFRYIGTARR